MKLLLLLGVLAARLSMCSAPPPASPIVVVEGHLYGVVHLDGWISENASNAGGLYFTLSIDGMPRDHRVYAGGHAQYGDGIGLPGMGTPVDGWSRRYYVAELSLGPDPLESPCPDTWCTHPMPTCYGSARHLRPAASLSDARAMLAELAQRGAVDDCRGCAILR